MSYIPLNFTRSRNLFFFCANGVKNDAKLWHQLRQTPDSLVDYCRDA